MRFRNIILGVVIVLVSATSCKTLMSYVNVLKCDFRMKSLSNTTLAGINIQEIRGFSDLNLLQAASLTRAYVGGNIPLSFLLNLEVKNPNPAEATLARFDWILSIDDIEMVSGTNEQEYTISANNGMQVVPMHISVNLLDVLNDKTKDSLLNFGFNLADAGNKPTRVGLKLKPTVYVNSIPVTYPGYITVDTEFGTQE